MEKVLSNKKLHAKIHLNGFTYSHSKTRGVRSYYMCERYASVKCPGRLIVLNGTDATMSKSHSHLPDVRVRNKAVVLSTVKNNAKNNKSGARELIAEATALVDVATKAIIPTMRNMIRTAKRVQKVELVTVNPKSLEELVFDDIAVLTKGNANFLFWDNKDNDNRILIFTTTENLKFLELCDVIAVDGTFKISPPLFKQLFTTHGRRRGQYVPLVYVLCLNKKQKTYEDIFKVIVEAAPGLKPTHIILDFERATINALVKYFPTAEVHGCFFHFTQSIWRHVQGCGLQEKYCSDATFAHGIRTLMALALVPVQDVVNVFEQLVEIDFWKDDDQQEFNDQKQILVNYFEITYIGAPGRRGQRKKPMFDIKLWNLHQMTLLGIPRTNNNVEGWHNSMNGLTGCSHPVIFKFIANVVTEQANQEVNMVQINAGEKLAKKNNKYERFDRRLRTLVEEYGAVSDKIKFLMDVSHNIYT